MENHTSKKWKSWLVTAVVIVVNVMLIALVILSVLNAINTTESNSTAQNVANIRTLTEASAEKVSLKISSSTNETTDTAYYINNYNGVGMNADEISAYFTAHLYNYDADERNNWLIVDKERVNYEYIGRYVVDNPTATVSFKDSIVDLSSIFGGASEATLGVIQYAEQTNVGSVEKGFSINTTIRIRQDDDTYVYKTLFLLIETDYIESIIVSGSSSVTLDYEGYSAIIIDKKGDCMITTSALASQETNCWDYLKTYNSSFTDAERTRMLGVLANANGDENNAIYTPLYYQNNKHKDCIFTLSPIRDTEWFAFSVVPLDSFRISYDFNMHFLTFALLFVALFAVDLVVAIVLIMRLRLHMRLEQVANASKSSFLSRMSHEIRTPLNAVMGYMTIARNNPDDRVRVDDCIMKTEVSAKHLLSVINDILDVSAIESGKITIVKDSFNLKSMINALTVMFFSLSSLKKIKFDVLFENLVDESVVGDQMRLNQVLINLLNNANKFTPEMGSVVLKISQEKLDERNFKITFKVSDTGIGMSQEYMDRIFQPFEQADNTISRKYGGSGLGLLISKTLTEMMDGSISVESELGKGSTFTVSIPFGRVEEKSLIGEYDFSNINALVVDDDPVACEYAKSLLNHYNIPCGIAYSGEEALRDISAAENGGQEKYNLCLIDMQMDGLNGLETAKKIKELYGDEIPVFILSAYDLSVYRDEASKIGIKKFLTKPLFRSALFDLLISIKNKDSDNPDHAEDSHLKQDKEYNFYGAKVLLVEDNEINMEIAEQILAMANLTADKVYNGAEAVKTFLEAPRGTYKAIIMDVQMPVMDGYTATKEIRNSAHPDAKAIPIIAMTANAFDQDVKESLEAGMNDHVSKPIDEKYLFEVLKKLGV